MVCLVGVHILNHRRFSFLKGKLSGAASGETGTPYVHARKRMFQLWIYRSIPPPFHSWCFHLLIQMSVVKLCLICVVNFYLAVPI